MFRDLMTSVMKSEANGPEVAGPAETAPVSAAANRAEGEMTDRVEGVLSFCACVADACGKMPVAPVATAAVRKRRRSGLGNRASASLWLIEVIPGLSLHAFWSAGRESACD